MTFEEIVNNKQQWIGGILETIEGAHEGYNSKILNVYIKGDMFHVECVGGGICVSMKDSPIYELKNNVLTFRIPYVGTAFMYGKINV